MMSKPIFQKLQNNKFTLPGIILTLVLLAYGLLAPWQGFYWDDWPFAWLLRSFGPYEFIEAFRPFRPFLGYIFSLTTFLFGGTPFAWQLVGLVIRFLLSCSLWTVFKLVWPSQKWNSIWIVLLFTVFPGYQQQWVSLTHVNQELIPLLWLVSSFAAAAYAVRNPQKKIPFTLLALFLQAIGLFSTEYFFGIEILRLFFLIVILSETAAISKELIRKIFFNWLPYLLIWVGNAVWLYSYHHSTAYQSYDIDIFSRLSISPLSLVNEALATISISGFMSWLNTFQIISSIDGSATQAFSLLILLFSGALVFFYMQPADGKNTVQDTSKNDKWGLQVTFIGLVAIFAGRLPSWAAGLPLKLEFDYDRFMLSIMLGASMFIVGLASLIFQHGKRKILILSLVIAFSTAYQFTVSNSFRRDWNNQRTFFWQLAWRIPALEKKTALLTYELPIKYASDFQITAPINWMYSSSIANRELPYLLLYIKSRINSPALPSLKPDSPIELQYRTTKFSGNTSNTVVLYKEADGCLRVLDSVYGNSETVPGANYYLTDAIPLSNPNQILAGSPQPVLDETLFGKEPAHDWCYYYEKAELARQQSDWKTIVKLHKHAQKAGLTVSLPVENFPFIEAYANAGDLKTALELTQQTVKQQKELCPAINSLWDRIFQSLPPQTFNLDEIKKQFRLDGCKL
ncbi:MAG: hypothetical protein NTW32_19120 [Chloroflexi bacterium]|nr:hypothetical protein [Chloroflexota bacterium]